MSDTGLGPSHDGGTGDGTGTTVWCYAGTIDRANWPVGSTTASCSMACGPDDLGIRACTQTDVATCQKESTRCVCLVSPCAKCADCALLSLSACYIPTNVASPPACDASVVNGGTCSTPCGKSLCIEADGETGCVCNGQGRYACAPWGGSNWK